MKPWQKSMWCIPPEQDTAFVAAMEQVLTVYQRPYDARFPVVNMDEQPIQLISHTRDPLPMRPGATEKVDYGKGKGDILVLEKVECPEWHSHFGKSLPAQPFFQLLAGYRHQRILLGPAFDHTWFESVGAVGIHEELEMGKEWEKNGKRMGKEWEKNGKRMGKEWEKNGKRNGKRNEKGTFYIMQ